MSEKPFTRYEGPPARPLRPPPPPEDPEFPELPAVLGGPDPDDDLDEEVEREAERLLGQYPAPYQDDLEFARAQARRRLRRNERHDR